MPGFEAAMSYALAVDAQRRVVTPDGLTRSWTPPPSAEVRLALARRPAAALPRLRWRRLDAAGGALPCPRAAHERVPQLPRSVRRFLCFCHVAVPRVAQACIAASSGVLDSFDAEVSVWGKLGRFASFWTPRRGQSPARRGQSP